MPLSRRIQLNAVEPVNFAHEIVSVCCNAHELAQIRTDAKRAVNDRGIVHGGLSAMIIDEALGALVYLLKREEVLGPGPAFTAHLGVDYKKVSAVSHSTPHLMRPGLLGRNRYTFALQT